VDDPRINAVVDVRAYLSQKLQALRAHRTQIKDDWFWLAVPEDLRDDMFNNEYFIRVASRVLVPDGDEDDVFAGLRGKNG
jgi:LmbE family N-acetylglucosaminyl deacetylase